MNDYLVAEFVNSVDSIISQPILQTQRIKYTAYDVSDNFIIFGASSGGLYIFNRHPCSFIKLIPSTEGSVVYLSISNDEKIIAVATSKGSLCLFNNDDTTSKNVSVYTEHQGHIITAMKWHHNSNELYSGDNKGKISVVVVTNFITKTMFQTPCATLMQLDSRIVQLDWDSNFLLVSTLSRVYLCDTQSEHYRQIGKKLRDGEFGACFFGSKYTYTLPSEQSKIELGSFSILTDKESFATYDGLENLKLFCARPGGRIWEVQLNGTVVRTHQFKQALMQSNCKIISLDNDCDGRLNYKNNPAADSASLNSCNFTKMYILDNQFILTFQRNGLYILDPQNVAVIFSTNIYSHIIDVRVVKKFIYIWTKKQIYVILFSTLEDFIVKCLLNKKYLLCADLSINYQNHIKKILPLSKKLYLLSSLNEKLLEIDATDLHDQIQPILNMIKEFCSNRKAAQKLSSGIFVLDNAHYISNSISDNNTQMSSQNAIADNNIKFESDNIQLNEPNHIVYVEKTKEMINDTSDIIVDELNKKYQLLHEEYELNKINSNYRTNLLETVFKSISAIPEIVEIFIGFENHSKTVSDISNWCYETCLKYIETHKDQFSIEQIENNNYLRTAFEFANIFCVENVCQCGFPLSKASLSIPKFYEIGKILIRHSWKSNSDQSLCYKVPYLWKDIIELRNQENMNDLLSIILQYGDLKILNDFLHKFTYDLWNDLVQKFILLKRGICLNCEQKLKCKYLEISWSEISTEMVKSIGADSSVCLLLQNAENIPNSELNLEFYQGCIFSSIVDNFDTKLRNKAVSFVKNVHGNDSHTGHFSKLLEKSLLNSEVSCAISYSVATQKKTCFLCTMPLQTPVLCKEKIVELPCGHFLHNICFKSQDHMCVE